MSSEALVAIEEEQESGDEVMGVPHESVAKVSVNTGLRAHRLALRTPRNIYTAGSTPQADETPDDERSTVMSRGQPVEQPHE